jgi:hypothetical protein
VHNALGLNLLEQFAQGFVFAGVTETKLQIAGLHAVPGAKAGLGGGNGSERLGAQFLVVLAAGEIVGNPDLVTVRAELKGCRPTTETIAAQYQYSHLTVVLLEIRAVPRRRRSFSFL